MNGKINRRVFRYRVGQKDEFFNRQVFFECALHGIITACTIFFFSYLSVIPSTQSSGMPVNDIQHFGFLVATILIVVVNLENGLETWHWNVIYIAVLIATIALHFLFHLFLYSVFLRNTLKVNYMYVGVFENALATPSFWFTLPLICALLLLPMVARE